MKRIETIGPCELIRYDAFDILGMFAEPINRMAVITDPPYGIGYRNNGGYDRPRDLNIIGDNSTAAADEMAQWADKHKIPLCMFSAGHRIYRGEWRNVLVWNKGNATGGGGHLDLCWKRTHELILIRNNKDLNGSRDPSVLNFPVIPIYDLQYHPAQKPVALLAYLIKKLTQPMDVVFDPFAGSFSMAVACIQTGRRYIGCEIEERHYETGINRVKEAMGKGTLYPDQSEMFAGST